MVINANLAATDLPIAPTPQAGATGDDAAMRQAAKAFESVFVAEMLKHAKLNEAAGPFSGGQAEDTFRMLMTREYADQMAQSESFGLASAIYAELKQKAAANAE